MKPFAPVTSTGSLTSTIQGCSVSFMSCLKGRTWTQSLDVLVAELGQHASRGDRDLIRDGVARRVGQFLAIAHLHERFAPCRDDAREGDVLTADGPGDFMP